MRDDAPSDDDPSDGDGTRSAPSSASTAESSAWPNGPLRRFVRGLYDPFVVRGQSRPPRRLGSFLRWAHLGIEPAVATLLICTLTVGFSEVLLIDGIGRLIDAADASGRAAFFDENLWLLLWLGLLIAVVRPIAILGQAASQSLVLNTGLGSGVVWKLHRYTLGQSLSFFESDFAGRIAQKELQTAAAVQTMTVDGINGAGMLVAFVLGMTIALGAIDPWFILVGVVWSAAYALILYTTLPDIRSSSKTRAEHRSLVTGQVVDSFANIRAVKLFAHAGREEAAAVDSLRHLRDAGIEVGVHIMRLRLSLQILNAALMLAAIGLPLALWLREEAALGALSAAAMLAFRLSHMSNWIAFMLFSLFSELGALEDGIDTLSPAHAITDPPEPVSPATIRDGSVRFDAVDFSYDAPIAAPGWTAPAALRAFTLDIEAGEKVGMVGPSGAGKSTVVSLLLRLHDVSDGAVRLGGVDVRALAQDELRRRIAVVSQETQIFNRSAFENIRYGDATADIEAVRAAARLARADHFIQDLVDRKGRRGYQARLGERGVRLSGGQRQRLALARAFLKDAPVLVLDEATSALDSEVEADILAALPRLMAGKTALAIAHRLSTLAEMDRIVVLDDGRIVEEGAHEALLARGGLYARLWARQSGGFLPRRLEDA